MRTFNYIIYKNKKYYDTKTFYDQLLQDEFPELRIIKHNVEEIEFQEMKNRSCRVAFEQRNFPVSKKIKIIDHAYNLSNISNCTFLIFTSDNNIFNYYYPHIIDRQSRNVFGTHELLKSEMEIYKKISDLKISPFKEFNPDSVWFEGKQIDFSFFKNFKSPVKFYVEDNKMYFFRIYNFWQVYEWVKDMDDEKFQVTIIKITTGNDNSWKKYVNMSSMRIETGNYSLTPCRILFRGKYRMEIYLVNHVFADDMEKIKETSGIPELDRILFTLIKLIFYSFHIYQNEL